ncbi:NADPH-dependent oxidoreductase [Enterococcus columbae]|uniref:Nitroreductase domain-containing protein n=1 Tax=Enterococcus columbae DSM 7374 = ATCC 51263 TaxID=1121865 RepID=S1N6B1_9ENTE|nr:NADPH-dependent oxidoreductase [Enterococcus columbae]EOT44397.1 hypothetical protein OMW_00453 [Enterococcus columbae DSM 7374 = ATCC 51263]EOW84555.1 hypothetical protein I568_01051 [Enterococcus columbae DSM 7374 = ATCC 51263]
MHTIEQMKHHVSVRNYQKKAIPVEIKQELLLAAQSGSTSNFVQAYSIIEIGDQAKKRQLAEITKFSGHLNQAPLVYVFVADLYRHAAQLEKHHRDLAPLTNTESFVVSIVDATIAAQNMCVAAESLGLGICYIGGIRNDLFKVKELLNLPKLTVPLFALSIGYPNEKNDPKPRLPLNNLVSMDSYKIDEITNLANYDEQTSQYYQNRNSHQANITWTEKDLDFFSEVRRPEFARFLKEQGFDL